MENFLSTDDNLFSIKVINQDEKKIQICISEDFELDIDPSTFKISTEEDFLNELCNKLNKRTFQNISELLISITKEYGILMDPDSPLYQGQDVFELENDNNDIKFLDRIRFKEEDFNSDLWLNVFNFLNPLELLKLSRISKTWFKLIENETLWKSFCIREDLKDPNKLKWKDYYKDEKNHKFKWTILSNTIQLISKTCIKQTNSQSNVTNERVAYCDREITEKDYPFSVYIHIVNHVNWIGVGLTLVSQCKPNQAWTGSTNDLSWIYSDNGYKWSKNQADNGKSGFPKYKTGDIIEIYVDPKLKKVRFQTMGYNRFEMTIELPCLLTANICGNGDCIEIINKRKFEEMMKSKKIEIPSDTDFDYSHGLF